MKQRLVSIDSVRGTVMILMALDHVRDLMHRTSLTQSPTDLSSTTPVLFFTRWITHLCAPTFVFLAGTSVYLSVKKMKDRSKSRSFLLQRGLWLVLLEFTLVNFGMFFDLGFHQLLFEVIAAIGVGFLVLALLLPLSSRVVLLLGLFLLCAHDAVGLLPFLQSSMNKSLWSLLFFPGPVALSVHRIGVMAYPPIPWLAIMLVGYGAGQFFVQPTALRRKSFLWVGISSLLLFFVLRMANVYGDSFPWAKQKDWVMTLLSFLNVTKYPPSLLFSLLTLGVMFLLLWTSERRPSHFMKVTTTYGKVPLFYFVVHFYLIHLILLGVLLLQGISPAQWNFSSGSFGRPQGQPSGTSLGLVYVLWATVVAMLYYPCRWFGRYKAAHPHYTWLRYL
ncbi:MAG: DUF1624 domain-containing protein [Flavisolibacter sp.]